MPGAIRGTVPTFNFSPNPKIGRRGRIDTSSDLADPRVRHRCRSPRLSSKCTIVATVCPQGIGVQLEERIPPSKLLPQRWLEPANDQKESGRLQPRNLGSD